MDLGDKPKGSTKNSVNIDIIFTILIFEAGYLQKQLLKHHWKY